MNEKRSKLLYGNYKKDEIAAVSNILEMNSIIFKCEEIRTNRGIPYFYLEAMVTKQEELKVRCEVNRLVARHNNWGKIGYQKTV